MNLFRTIWELPQNLLGFIVKKVTKATEYTKYKDATVYSWKVAGGMSLGQYIFVPFSNTTPLQRVLCITSSMNTDTPFRVNTLAGCICW